MKIKQLTVLSFSVLIFACRAGFEVDDISSDTNTSNGSANNSNVTLTQIQNNIFSNNCTGSNCHSGINAQRGVRLDSATNTYNTTVNVSSSGLGNNRVTPNDAENSYLVQKIEGRGTGSIMPPPPASPLSTSQINNIRNWIDNGALQAGASTTGTQVYTTSQVMSDELYAVEFEFGREIDAAVVRKSDIEFVLEYGDYSITTHPSEMKVSANKLEVSIGFGSGMEKPQSITTSFNKPSLVPIQDVLAREVDGDGDGADGGEFKLHYSPDPK